VREEGGVQVGKLMKQIQLSQWGPWNGFGVLHMDS